MWMNNDSVRTLNPFEISNSQCLALCPADFLIPENANVERLKVKVLLLMQNDDVVVDDLEVAIMDDGGIPFALDDDLSCGDLPFSEKGVVAIMIYKRRKARGFSAAALEAADVPLDARIDRCTREFEDRFRSAVSFRLDDYLWEQEAVLDKQAAMSTMLRGDVDQSVRRAKELTEQVDEAVSSRKSLIARKLAERAEEVAGASSRKELEKRKAEAAKHMSSEEKMNASIQQRLR